MNFIGDYFALGLISVLFMFFFDSKVSIRHMSVSSKIFIACLCSSALTAAADLGTGYLLEAKPTPLWLNMLVNSIFFFVAIVATSSIALYLFTKILEHTHVRHCMRNAKIALISLLIFYGITLISNWWTGWVFHFLPDGTYVRGPLNTLGYVIALIQLFLVLVCFLRNKKTASNALLRVLIQISPVIPLCSVVHHFYPDIMLNSFVIALVDTVLFLTFQGQRQGVHSLTELNDRHRFFNEVDYRISKKEPFHILLINIKNYGSINQKYGHVFGDEILYQFAFSLEKLLTDSITFHMNGTVFAVVLRYTYQNIAEKQCGSLLEFMESGIQCGDNRVDIDYVVAHYIANGNETSATGIYEVIEYSVSKAHNMKNRYIQCNHEDSGEVERKRYLLNRLRTINREHGFEVWFQPIQCLSSGKYCSMEALVRLREPDGTLISPAEFVPLAEQTGLISSLTWFVLEEVCRTLKYTPILDNVSVSINMPQAQLLEKGFIPRFISTVNQAGIDHRRICIEFTERAILDNFKEILSIMETLTKEGFRFYLDDFGVSYSNFNCLLQLPFHTIKLDPCLVKNQNNGQSDYATIHALTNLFHDMSLTVVAEGAETMEEVQALIDQGVDRIQGFALAAPMPIDKLIDFYDEHPMN